MSSEESNVAVPANIIPTWVEALIFEPTLNDITPDFKQIKEFKVNKALSAGENYNTLVLHLEINVELNGIYI